MRGSDVEKRHFLSVGKAPSHQTPNGSFWELPRWPLGVTRRENSAKRICNTTNSDQLYETHRSMLEIPLNRLSSGGGGLRILAD
jgi:hypothetical protein